LNIVLIGFMGSGKTTIGRKLAVRLGYRFVDMDRFIEEEQQCKIAQIFEERGEAAFRSLETGLLKRLKKAENTVVSTGGGVVTIEGNIEIIRSIGISIYLKAGIDNIFERVSRNNKRPLLQTDNPLQTIKDMMEKREGAYSQADLILETNSLSMGNVVSKIIQSL
jgi:shikimate kinase